MPTTPVIEITIKNDLDNYISSCSLKRYRDDLLSQYDNFIASSHNNLINNAVIIDDEDEDLNNYEMAENCKSVQDVYDDELKNIEAGIITPIILLSHKFISMSIIQHHISSKTTDPTNAILLYQTLKKANRLDIYELIGATALIAKYSDPDYFEDNFEFYIKNNPAYANCDFNDPMLKTMFKTHLGIDL